MLQIVPQNEAFLKTPSRLLTLDDMELYKSLVQPLRFGIYKYDALGIAAVQLGQDVNVICVRGPENTTPKLYVNAELVYGSGIQIDSTEGCLSIPGRYYKVKRFPHARIVAQDFDSNNPEKRFIIDVDYLDAVVWQHEIGHVKGVLIKDIGTEVEVANC